MFNGIINTFQIPFLCVLKIFDKILNSDWQYVATKSVTILVLSNQIISVVSVDTKGVLSG